MKKKTRDLERTRKEILEIAFWEVFTRGFQGVSVDEIVKKTSLTKGAFYHVFPTKLDLGYALVDEVISPMIEERWLVPLADFQNPLEGILKQMQKLIGKDAEHLKYGCPLNNLVQEMAPVDKGFKKRLGTALTSWISGTEKELKRAQKEGFIKGEVNVKDLATFIVMAHEGFYGMLKGNPDPKSFNALFRTLKITFNTVSVRPLP